LDLVELIDLLLQELVTPSILGDCIFLWGMFSLHSRIEGRALAITNLHPSDT